MARRNGGHSPPLSIPLAALIALIYLHTKPLKTCGRNFSWLWRMLKALKGWIKASGAGGRCPCPASSACTFCICLADFCGAGGRSSCLAWLWSPACPGPCPSSARARSPSSSTPPPLSPPILNWLTCTLITFQEDLFYLCCASAGKALNKYFAYFLMTMNGINHAPGIVLQLMFTF